MAITTSTITGRVPLPDNTVRAGSYVSFQLTGVDTDGETIVTDPVIAPMDGTGNISVELWPNARGIQRTKYKAMAHMASVDGETFRAVALGMIEVPAADVDISTLIGIRIPASPSDTHRIYQGESINMALQYLDENALPKTIAGITITSWIALPSGPQVPMAVATIVEADGTFEVALSHLTTASLTPGVYGWWVRMAAGGRVSMRSGKIAITGVPA